MASIVLEVRQAARGLVRNPGYSAGVLLTLALGIGAAAAVFALIDGVLMKPLPYPDADRLVLIRQQNLQDEWNTSVVDFRAVEEQARSFEAVAAMRSMDVIVTDGPEPQWVSARWVTAGFFEVMGMRPASGRGFNHGEDAPGAAPVVVLGHDFAGRRFGAADPLGRTLTVDGVVHTVVGVMPRGVDRLAGMRADLWAALRVEEPERRGPFFLNTVARLKPDVTTSQVMAELSAISRRIFPLWQQGFQDETARLVAKPLQAAIVGDAGRFLWIAFGAVLAVLLIAVVNIANLVLMRATERLKDLSVRAAMGATRRRLARFLIIESLLLAAAGGLVGVALATVLLDLYRTLGPELPRLTEVAIDFRVAAFAAVVVVASGVFFGVAPLLFTRSGDVAAPRRMGRAGAGRSLARSGLVTLQFALALPLLVAAGLLLNSLMHLHRVDPGFDTERLLTARVRLLETRYPDAAARLEFWERMLAELRGVPGVITASLASGVPPDTPFTVNNFDLVGRPAVQGSQPVSPWTPVWGGYFDALGVPILEGRGFHAGDRPDTDPVVVVSRSWAERFFPDESAVGQQLYEGGDLTTPVTIIGVTGDVKFTGLDQPGESVFAPLSQGWPGNPAYLYLRTSGDPLALAEPMRRTLGRLDPAVVPTEVTTMQRRLRDSLGDERHWTVVILGFALAAVLLSAVGVSGVLAYYVSRQYREIGIRLALGADAGRVLTMVIRRGLACALGGSAIGVVLAMFLARGLESLLFEVRGTDPATLAAACTLLLVVALIASWLPARRAARVDAAVALRAE